MDLHADLRRPVVRETLSLEWIPSTMAGVARRMFVRHGGKVARATAIARSTTGSHLKGHSHGCSEESLVLDGLVQDQPASLGADGTEALIAVPVAGAR